ncbi:MAG TPA: hypothetical protein VK453_01255 [Micromonosporaceae bacterium]|nr:hypothetical protein [Micromonosporaceae bacterium]
MSSLFTTRQPMFYAGRHRRSLIRVGGTRGADESIEVAQPVS